MKKHLDHNEKDLIVVGIGASAGGLEALQDFFKNTPENTDLSFVVIQHLSPDYKSLMNELLARCTNIPIHLASDGLKIQKNNIYLIPPRKNIRLFHNKLYLEDQNFKKGLNLPVDIFFHSLAQEKGKHAIGIILSGTGSDGTLGTKAIKEAGGMIMVQDENSAKFDGMPKNSIATGLVDYIISPDKMPEALISFVKHPLIKKNELQESLKSENIDTLSKIVILIREYSGIDFSYYKENTILRRLERRISINRFDTIEEYLKFLTESSKEKEILNRELLIGVTRFFRDYEAFESIKRNVIPDLALKKHLRIWSAGCSTGEEVYSLAILLNEHLEKNQIDTEVKIFATDVDRNSVEFASKGVYPESVMADVDPVLLAKYFIRYENTYQIVDKIRKMIVFATHNLLKDSPFSKIDLLICRNLFIYLKPEIQKKILSVFYYSLSTEGYLFMGSSETIGELAEAFNCVDTKWKIYQQKHGFKPSILKELSFIPQKLPDTDKLYFHQYKQIEGVKFEKLFDSLLSRVLPPSVILDSQENIIHSINDVSAFIKIQPGRFSQNISHNVSSEIAICISTLIRKLKTASEEKQSEAQMAVRLTENKNIMIKIISLNINNSLYYLLSFETELNSKQIHNEEIVDMHFDNNYQLKIVDLEKELQFTRENLQATVEELETSNEELQSSNEELIASNEELQSTNEELQSVNEELYTVNSEYQQKIEDLTRLNNDMNNLIKNTEVGALYLDRNLCIRKITPLVSKITNILPSDIGRPVTHLTILNQENTLIEEVLKVADDLQPVDKELVIDENICWLIRIRPYRTDFNAVEGLLVTFIEISGLKQEHKRANLANDRLYKALKIGKMVWWEWDLTTNQVIYDDQKALMLGYQPDEFPNDVYDICNLIHPEDYEHAMQSMKDSLSGLIPEWKCIYRIRKKDHTYSWFYDKGSITQRDINHKALKMTGTVIDISDLKSLEQQLNDKNEMIFKILDINPIANTMVDRNGNIIYANQKACELLNIKIDEINQLTYNADSWQIKDINGNPVPDEALPFSIIKKTLEPLTNYLHTIVTSSGETKTLSINGTPVLDINHQFDGAVFTLGEIYEKR